jgi:hypothetical protein
VQRKQVTLIRQILYHKKKIFFLAWQRKLFSAEASKPNGRRKADKNAYPLDGGSSQLQTAHGAANANANAKKHLGIRSIHDPFMLL